MTRKSKREIERAVEGLGDDQGDDGGGMTLVYDYGDEYLDEDGEPVPTDEEGSPTPSGAGLVVILSGVFAPDGPDAEGRTCIMMRDHAEREGREILGPAEDAPADDAVRVRRE
jgi:hypothetical protein